jgi:hypothetical protein
VAERCGKSGCVPCPAAKLGAQRPAVATESTSGLAHAGTVSKLGCPGALSKLAYPGAVANELAGRATPLPLNSRTCGRATLLNTTALAVRGQCSCRKPPPQQPEGSNPAEHSGRRRSPTAFSPQRHVTTAFSTSEPAAATCTIWDADPLLPDLPCVAFWFAKAFLVVCLQTSRVAPRDWLSEEPCKGAVAVRRLSPNPASFGQHRSLNKHATLVDSCQSLLQGAELAPHHRAMHPSAANGRVGAGPVGSLVPFLRCWASKCPANRLVPNLEHLVFEDSRRVCSRSAGLNLQIRENNGCKFGTHVFRNLEQPHAPRKPASARL